MWFFGSWSALANTDQHCEAGNRPGVIAVRASILTGRVIKSESAKVHCVVYLSTVNYVVMCPT